MKNQKSNYNEPKVEFFALPTDIIMGSLEGGGDDDEGMWMSLLNGAGFPKIS